MRTIVVDKVASVTQACGLGHEVRIATDGLRPFAVHAQDTP